MLKGSETIPLACPYHSLFVSWDGVTDISVLLFAAYTSVMRLLFGCCRWQSLTCTISTPFTRTLAAW